MSEEQQQQQKRSDPGDSLRDGMRAVLGVLGAFKDAIEDTFEELKQQGELSPERAKRAAQSTMRRAQETVDDVRGRLEFVTRRDFDELGETVAELQNAVARLNEELGIATESEAEDTEENGENDGEDGAEATGKEGQAAKKQKKKKKGAKGDFPIDEG